MLAFSIVPTEVKPFPLNKTFDLYPTLEGSKRFQKHFQNISNFCKSSFSTYYFLLRICLASLNLSLSVHLPCCLYLKQTLSRLQITLDTSRFSFHWHYRINYRNIAMQNHCFNAYMGIIWLFREPSNPEIFIEILSKSKFHVYINSIFANFYFRCFLCAIVYQYVIDSSFRDFSFLQARMEVKQLGKLRFLPNFWL